MHQLSSWRRSVPAIGRSIHLLVVLCILGASSVAVGAEIRPWRTETVLSDDGKETEGTPFGTTEFYVKAAFAFVLCCVGGLFAGLTIGYFSLDLTNLEILKAAGEERQKKMAMKIEPVRSRGHLLLITLLLGNVVVNETLPLIMDDLTGGTGGITVVILSTALVVLFGEIIPNALCSRYGLEIGAFFAPLANLLMIVLYPLAWPIGKLLDWLLGEKEGTVYRRAELKTLVSLHNATHLGNAGLSEDEVNIISAVLDLSHKTVAQVYTPLEDAYLLEIHQKLDKNTVRELKQRGVSRVPVYDKERSNLVAIFLAKQLLDYDPHDCLAVNDFPLAFLPVVSSATPLFDMLNFFQEGRSHMAAVSLEETRAITRRPAPLRAPLRRSNTGVPPIRKFSMGQEAVSAREASPAPPSVRMAGRHTVDMQPVSKIIGILTLEDVLEEAKKSLMKVSEVVAFEIKHSKETPHLLADEFVDVHTKEPVQRKPWRALKAVAKFISPFQNTIPSPPNGATSEQGDSTITGSKVVSNTKPLRPAAIRRHFLLGQPGESPVLGPRPSEEFAPLLGESVVATDYGSTVTSLPHPRRQSEGGRRSPPGRSRLSVEVKHGDSSGSDGSSVEVDDGEGTPTQLVVPVLAESYSGVKVFSFGGARNSVVASQRPNGDPADFFLSRRHSDVSDDGKPALARAEEARLFDAEWGEEDDNGDGKSENGARGRGLEWKVTDRRAKSEQRVS
ncbi:DUF21-domain-containing protein [Gonapodya prolifera JEL478]|uniref:DUF21-domain-containing protein n=1 Tax=Gonapodya prolifera (strain JEL478) TaxID=1344416 RepID=A0A139AWV1_GONPJ|nr:DUF21-domain-containing protein [Gonapodya prolifera JEL478]|eukprot:KXS21216.1 DUF21-domain-containing protein [Gonapodya prolifera JEL478]